MGKDGGEISHVSDTARWVAIYRAMESERPDALFRDPYARRLAGERGERIVRAMPSGRASAWPMIVRTQLMDEAIRRLVAEGVDEVLDLAAGLDTRAYRLQVPPSLRWTDVDFPDVIAYKTEALRDERPACVYETAGVDLADAAARGVLFDRIDARSQRVLVVSEGLLVYLEREQVGSIAADLRARPHFAYWLLDLASPRLLQMMQKSWGPRLAQGNAPFRFGPEENTRFFEPYGWRELEYRNFWDEGRRLNRRMRGAWLWDLLMALTPPRQRATFQRFAGTALLERAGG